MQPVDLLMAEHRLILKMVARMREQAANMEALQTVNAAFVDAAVDFMRNYADRCHHAKEEKTLFHDAAKKPLPGPMRQTLEELIEEHARARTLVEDIAAGRQEYLDGNPEAWRKVTGHLRALIVLYPAHVRREDRQFFPPAMEYLSPQEKLDMIETFHQADRRLIHEHYARVLCRWAPAGAPAK